jgi:hypothetical protein
MHHGDHFSPLPPFPPNLQEEEEEEEEEAPPLLMLKTFWSITWGLAYEGKSETQQVHHSTVRDGDGHETIFHWDLVPC